MADDDVRLSFPPEQQAELEQIAQERGGAPGDLIAEAVEAWSLAHAEEDGTPGLEARVMRSGRLSPHQMAEVIQEAVTWWLADPTLRTLQ